MRKTALRLFSKMFYVIVEDPFQCVQQSFQLQFEGIVLPMLSVLAVLASSSEQCPDERAHVLCQAKSRIISLLLWMYHK